MIKRYDIVVGPDGTVTITYYEDGVETQLPTQQVLIADIMRALSPRRRS